MKKIFLLSAISTGLLLVCFIDPAHAQNRKIDSLRILLPTSNGGEYIDILFELARSYDDDYVNLKYTEEAFNKAKIIRDTARIIRTGRLKSQILRSLGKIDSSILLGGELLPIAKRHNDLPEVKSILNSIGIAYTFLGQYDKALQYHLESLNLRRDGGDRYDISTALYNIGMVYYKLKEYGKALSYYRQIQSEFEIGSGGNIFCLI